MTQTDGLEAEYGPVPKRVPNNQWYDWAVVHNVLYGRSAPRTLTTPEMADLMARRPHWSYETLAERLGQPRDSVKGWGKKERRARLERASQYIETI